MYGAATATNLVQPGRGASMRERLMNVLAHLRNAHQLVDSIEGSLRPKDAVPQQSGAPAPGPFALDIEIGELEHGLESLCKRLEEINTTL